MSACEPLQFDVDSANVMLAGLSWLCVGEMTSQISNRIKRDSLHDDQVRFADFSSAPPLRPSRQPRPDVVHPWRCSHCLTALAFGPRVLRPRLARHARPGVRLARSVPCPRRAGPSRCRESSPAAVSQTSDLHNQHLAFDICSPAAFSQTSDLHIQHLAFDI